MDTSVFSLEHFNVLEDEQYYYVFRALNRADHNDVVSGKTVSAGKIARIRTDRERWVEDNDSSRYSEDSEISLEEVWNHIKMHYSKETNCISLSSNANVSLDYGNGYYDEYADLSHDDKDSILDAYDVVMDELDTENADLESFVDYAKAYGILSDESLPEEEDVYDFVTRRAIHRYEDDYAKELEEMTQVYYVRGIEEGDIHWADTSQAYSSSDLVRDGHIIHGHKL